MHGPRGLAPRRGVRAAVQLHRHGRGPALCSSKANRAWKTPSAARGELADWRRNVAALCEGNTRLVFALACAFAGSLLRLVGIDGGGVSPAGHQQPGQDNGPEDCGQRLGPAHLHADLADHGQLAGIDGGVQHCDGLLILDEIGQVDGKVVGDCAYMLANGQEKGRSTRGGLNRRLRTWRLLFLSSGERTLADHMADAGKRGDGWPGSAHGGHSLGCRRRHGRG